MTRRSSFLVDIPSKSSTASVIAQALSLYVQALDLRFNHSCFLGLWQILETITLAEESRGNTDIVCKRSDWHGKELDPPGSGVRETLRVLAKKRNEIVHQGNDHVSDDDVNILKTICEAALVWLIEVREHLPTKRHMSEFYRLRKEDDTVLNTVSEAAKYIVKQRSSNSQSSAS